MVDIPILDGEEWWSSSAIDDADSVTNNFTSLLRACINSGINVDRSNVLLTDILANSVTNSIPLEVENWLDFCAHLSNTKLFKEASQMRDELEKFTHKHLPSTGSYLTSNFLTFDDFVKDSSAQSLGKFGEFLFSKYCDYKNIPYVGKHKGGVDFVIDFILSIDVKAIRHIKHRQRDRFRRHNIEKQLPNVHYAYIIFWNNSIELRVEKNDVKFGSYDCVFDSHFVNSVWENFDKKSVKFLDRCHIENTNFLKKDLASWIADNLGIRARVIQRKASAHLNKRSGGWGADNFYSQPPHNHEIVVLLGVTNGTVEYIHSYPTSEYLSIKVRPKPVGTNRKEILCYFVDKLDNKYKFKDIDDFKANVRERFNL